MNGPSQALTNLPITAAWSTDRVIPTRLVRNWGFGNLDVALIYLGAGDFGPVNIQLLALSYPEAGSVGLWPWLNNTTPSKVVKFGRGIFAYATAGPPPVAAQQDGQYRSATFTVSAVGATTYTLPADSAGQVGAGGDSGGPDILLAPNGVGLGIAGVLSGCQGVFVLPPNPLYLDPPTNTQLNWNWVTSVSSCTSAPIAGIRFDIVQIIQEAPVNLVPVYYEMLDP